MDNLHGRTIKGYELRERLGAGGFGAVYKAFQPIVGRDVAVKIILPQHANRPEFIRRFEVEAQVIARLEHIHIVPLYDYWRDPDGAYLVMRWLQGGSLRRTLRAGAPPIEVTTRVVSQIGLALSAAHRRGVIHRDLKPDNILLDDDGNAYLADFGIAKDLGRDNEDPQNVIVGSPAYLSPEQIRGEQVSPRTDIYSFGVVIYELLVGELPFPRTRTPIEFLEHHLNDPIPRLWDKRPDLPHAVDTVIQRATAKAPADRYEDAVRVSEELQKALTAPSDPAPGIIVNITPETLADDTLFTSDTVAPGTPLVPTPSRGGSQSTPKPVPSTGADEPTLSGLSLLVTDNPYKGLRAFQEADAADFFGRDSLTDTLLARLQETGSLSRFLAVVGPSGSGKSSAVRAGLLPALRRGRLPGSARWFTVEMIPGSHPLEELESSLLRVASNPFDRLFSLLSKNERGLAEAVQAILPADEGIELALVIDQFEEIFTLVEDEAARVQFLSILLAAVTAPGSRLRVIITLRADFFDRPLMYPAFGEVMRRRTEVVLPLSPAELALAISGPADRVGLTLEEGLVEAIVRDVGEQPGALPLLQYALTELFERRDGNTLTLAAYRDSGGVLGALARRADQLFEELGAEQQKLARNMFLRLVTLGEGTDDTRRRVNRTELTSLAPESSVVADIIEQYGKYRLLTFDRDPVTRGPTVEVAHEALIRTWERLRGWLDTSREDLRNQARLASALSEWVAAGRDPSFLASGVRLDQFLTWAADTTLALNSEERTYLDASVTEREAQHARDEARKAREAATAKRAQNFGRAAAVLAVVGVLAVIATVVAASQASSARAEVASANIQVATAQTQISVSSKTLTPVQLALQAGSTKIAQAQSTGTQFAVEIQIRKDEIESLRLAAEATKLLDTDSGNPELAALLSIRALRLAYTPQADAALVRAMSETYTRRIFIGHTAEVNAAIFSRDGSTILTASGDQTIRLWDAKSGTAKGQFEVDEKALGLSLSPNGSQLLVSGQDTLYLLNAASGKLISQTPGSTGQFSPDGSAILAGAGDGSVILWEIRSGKQTRQFVSAGGSPVNGVAISPDGKIAAAAIDSDVLLWDAQSGESLRKLSGHNDAVVSLTFSPDGALILTGSLDSTARLWDAGTGNLVREFTGHTDGLASAGFSPDGKLILTASLDKTARLWDATSGHELRRFLGHEDSVFSAAFSPDGKSVVTASQDRTARLWDAVVTHEDRQFIGHSSGINSVIFSPDGSLVLTGSSDRTARLWKALTGDSVQILNVTGAVYSVEFAADGQFILTGDQSNAAQVWDRHNPDQPVIFGAPQKGSSQVTARYSPDGTLVALAESQSVQLWTPAGKLIRQLDGHTGDVNSLAFSPDGKFLVTGSQDKTARLWDVATGQEIRQFIGHSTGIWAVAFSPDGKTVATGAGFAQQDTTIRLWDVVTGQEIRQFIGHGSQIDSLAFSKDGRLLLSSGADQTARLWDVATGQEVRRLVGHADIVWTAAFSPDGKYVVTGSKDRTARLWDVDYHDFVRYACTRVYRDLRGDERTQYAIISGDATCPN